MLFLTVKLLPVTLPLAALLLMLQVSIPAQKRYFYTNKPYGSEALFNPLSLLVNGGFDITQLQSVSNRLGDHQYGRLAKNVFRNLGDPFPVIRQYGTKKFLLELIPTSITEAKNTGPWIPNYQQHLIGGGMLYTAMREWYEERQIPHAWLFSATTVMAQHLLNEIMETGPYEGPSVDEISDIYIFDLGGILLFSSDAVNEFFSKELNLADWSLQASISAPSWRVNAGQFFSIKWQLPFWKDYSFFYRYGMGALFGLSTKISPEESISAGIGFKTKHLVDLDGTLRQRTIETGLHAGVFWDRNNSLLASAVFSGIREYFCNIDVYPGVLHYGNFSPGVWCIIGLNGNLTFGLTSRYLIGAGVTNF